MYVDIRGGQKDMKVSKIKTPKKFLKHEKYIKKRCLPSTTHCSGTSIGIATAVEFLNVTDVTSCRFHDNNKQRRGCPAETLCANNI